MAQTQTCDLCGEPAVDTVEMSSGKTTAVVLDVCEGCLAEWKTLRRNFAKQKVLEDIQKQDADES